MKGTSARVHFFTMDNMCEFDDVMSNIHMHSKAFPVIGPVPYEIHLSSTDTYYMADDCLTYGELQEAFNIWNDSDEPDEWVEITM